MEAFMRDLARLEDAPDPKEGFERYKEWAPFAQRNRAFFEASASDLGYDLEDLAQEPGKRLF